MKKLFVSLIAAGVIALLAFVGRAAVVGANQSETRGPEIARVVRGDVGSIVKATGVIRPAVGAEVRVGAQVSGVLKRLNVQIGDSVKKGQLLAELQESELRARHDQAAAALQSAKASLSFGVSDLARKRQLAAEQVIPQSELDLTERNTALAEAAVAEARANLAFARAQLDEARILAPINGVVASIATQEGETVAAGFAAPTFLTIVDLQRLEVWAYVDETDIGRIQIKQQARFSVDAYPDQEFKGEVTAIYPKPEIRDNVVNYVAVVRFAPPNQRTLRPEMTANVRIALETHAKVLTVPRRAVRREAGRSFVLRQEGSAVARRFVTTGSRDEKSLEIVEGLHEGDQVLVSEMPAGQTPAE